MSKITICDICEKRYPKIQLKYRIKYYHWIPMMMSPYTEKMFVCEDCWECFVKLVKENYVLLEDYLALIKENR